MAEITWTAEAQRWLQEIYDHIAQDTPDAAYRTVTAIHERAEVLLSFPEIGQRYRDADRSAPCCTATIASLTWSSPTEMSTF